MGSRDCGINGGSGAAQRGMRPRSANCAKSARARDTGERGLRGGVGSTCRIAAQRLRRDAGAPGHNARERDTGERRAAGAGDAEPAYFFFRA
jgi:hypothetical protein